MTDQKIEEFVAQALSTANNYFCTGRPSKALEMLGLVGKIDPDNKDLKIVMDKVYCLSTDQIPPSTDYIFGEYWQGQNLDGKSIEIICDQGMGDTINLLRYIKQLKTKYDCKIFLNYYAFFNELERLFATQKYIDKFTPFHEKCDYNTNIMSLPSILNAIEMEIHYPADFQEILKTKIPEQNFEIDFKKLDLEGNYKIGLAWQTNADNPLSQIKSIPIRLFSFMCLPRVNFYCLQPNISTPDWINPLPIKDMYDTANCIQNMDCVVTVDTAVLHLAGILGKKTFGLLPFDADPRWGNGSATAWYPSVELFRQPEPGQWTVPISLIRDRLVSFLKTL